MRRCSVVAVILCILCILALQPVQAWQVLTLSNLEHLSNDSSRTWQPLEFCCWQDTYNYRVCWLSLSDDWSEYYVNCDTGFTSSDGSLASIYPLFPLTPGGWNEPNTTPIRFHWQIKSVVPVYLVVYAGIDNVDWTTGEMTREETAIWNSGPISSPHPVLGSFEATQGTPQFFRIELTTTPVPEPTGILVILGGLGASQLRRKK